MSRKTIDVNTLIDYTNQICKMSGPEFKGTRQGAIYLLTVALEQTGNYRGFRYLRQEECIGKPGINYDGGKPHADIDLRFKNTDETRVEFIKRK